MSAGYASRLSDYENKGVCGLPELCETKRSLNLKLNRLEKLVRQSKHLVVLTGAGVSTSSGIPDFRGPKGIWTLEKKQQKKKKNRSNKRIKLSNGEAKQQGTITQITDNGKPPLIEEAQRAAGPNKRSRPEESKEAGKGNPSPQQHRQTGDDVDFESARPTLTHRAITKLASEGIVKYCITQNVDGLHRRSGLKRSLHSVLHGCVFTEQCENCGAEYFRNFDVGGMSHQKTGRKCDACGCDLRDTMLDWEDELPEADFARATQQCEQSDLVLCLGTSLRIEPAGSLPTLAKKFVIVNLQETPYDGQASMVIRASVDAVMADLMEKLGFENWEEDMPPVETVWRPDDFITAAETSM